MVMESVPCPAPGQHKPAAGCPLQGEVIEAASSRSLSSSRSSSSSGTGGVTINFHVGTDDVDAPSVHDAAAHEAEPSIPLLARYVTCFAEVHNADPSSRLAGGDSCSADASDADPSSRLASGVSSSASTPKMPRAFSVVPVNDLKDSPKTNLVHMKKKLKTYSKAYSDSDCEETESLLTSSLVDESLEESASPNKSLKYRKTSLDNLPVHVVSRSAIEVMPGKELTSESSCNCGKTTKLGSQPAAQSSIKSDTQTAPPPIDSEEATKEIKTPHTLMAPFRGFSSDPPDGPSKKWSQGERFPLTDRKLSLAATRFPRVELSRQDNIPMHYMTVNPGAGNNIFNTNSAQYYTVQPPRFRGYPNQTVLDTINSKFVNSNCNGTSSIDFGSTDGRNIKLMKRAVLSSDNIQMLANPTEGQCTFNSMTSLRNIEDTVCDLDVHSPVCSSHSTGPLVKEVERGVEQGEKDEDEGGRPTWDSKVKFVLACVGSCVGLGNFWRFPYLCYKSGGGAFMLPYFTMLFLCGIPLLLMEMAIGQYTRLGPIGALDQLCPIFVGSAVGVVIISIIFCSYYNVIISWSIFYLTQSFKAVLPWTECPPGTPSNATDTGCVMPGNGSATQYYFDTEVLQKSAGIEEFGLPVGRLVLCVVAAWLVVYFSVWKSVKSSGAVVMVTATTPYALILIFLVRAVTLEGAGDGLRLLFYPNWSQLMDIKVWVNAAAQNFNSIGIGFGSMITYSSYNKFSNNILMDVWVIALVNAGTSLLAGIIVFSTMGNIAYEHGTNITDVVSEGPGLAFVVYPQALAKMPFSNFFSVLFFSMLIILGIDSQFATVEVIVTSLKDSFPKWVETKLGRHEVLALLVCLFCLVLGLPNIFQGGIYYFNLLDYYSAAISLMYLAFFEVVAVVWCYGAGTLCRNIREMTGKMPSNYFKWCWLLVSPALITIIAIATWLDYQEPTYDQGTYTYPGWAIGLGWFIACLSIVPIPIGVLIKLYLAPGDTVLEKLKYAMKPKIESCTNCNMSSHNPEGPCRCIFHPPPSPEVFSLNTLNKMPEQKLGGSIPPQDANAAVRGRTAVRNGSEFDSIDVQDETSVSFS